jgi:predicted O-linked N-acetylglucosamine transferase (SPINDLY family)
VVSERVFTRQELGLPETGFVYCCFNNNYKISPNTFASWMNILKAVPGSVLCLLADNFTAPINLQKSAAQLGVDPKRLIFGGRLEASEYLARYKTANLFLDTWPYNAGTTATDALLVGLPVLTKQGQSFAARMASSVLTAMGLPELITTSVEEYQRLAIELGLNSQAHLELRQKVMTMHSHSLLFNPVQFTKSLEEGLTQALALAHSGQAPKNLYIRDVVALES